MNSFVLDKISDTRMKIEIGSRKIILIGTAHVSAESLEEVKTSILAESPDHVCVELDDARLKNLEKSRQWSSMDIKNVLRKKQGFMMMANLALTSFQRRMSFDTGVLPGEEMKAAVDICRENGIPFTCADRSVQITLNRAWRRSGFFSKLKLISSLIASVLSREKASAEEIEQLKETDVMQGMMSELAAYLPSIKTVLIDERDYFLAAKIFDAPGEKVLAVVGAAHIQGICKLLDKMFSRQISNDTSDIEMIPPKGWWGKALPWILPAIIIGLFVTGIVRSGLERGLEMSAIWILSNGIPASLGALAALAHPLTILASFIGAPVTSLNPTIGVGMVSGLLEYLLRNPRIRDIENLNSDIISLKGWYRNRITRILLVFFLSSLGSSIGTMVAIPWLTQVMGK